MLFRSAKSCDDLDNAISDFNNHKHEKLSEKDFDAHAHLKLIVNYLLNSMNGKLFGFCSHMEKEKFKKNSYKGHFRVAHDVQPFIDTYDINAGNQFSAEEALLFDKGTSKCLNLMPFIVWSEREVPSSPYLCCWFDMYDKKTHTTTLKHCDNKSMSAASDLSDDLNELYNKLIDTGLDGYASIYEVTINEIAT